MKKCTVLTIFFLICLITACSQEDALTNAVLEGDANQVKTFLENGANPNRKDSLGRPLLITAIIKENDKIVELLLDHGADPNSAFHIPAIRFAIPVVKCHERILNLLLQAGALPDPPDLIDGSTPLMAAASAGNIKCFRMLLRAGANIHATNRISNGNVAFEAALSGNVDVLSEILKSDVDVDKRIFNNFTPLMIAAAGRHRAFVQLLLKSGRVDACARNKKNKTAAMIAEHNGYKEISKLLPKCK